MKSLIVLQGNFKSDNFDLLVKGKIKEVFLLEGRPSLEAARRSSRELLKRKIIPTIVADNMAGFLFARGLVKEVWMAYQMADQNGAVCFIGGLILGVLAKKHKVSVILHRSAERSPFVAKQEEIFSFNGVRTAPEGIRGYVPLVEWVPKKYITKRYE